MRIHTIQARDLPDLWFQAVHDILDVGRRFVIDRGSYAGQTRLEYDYFTGQVTFPGTKPLLPDIPTHCNIPNPVEGICEGVRQVQANYDNLQRDILTLRDHLQNEWKKKLDELKQLLA